MCAPSCSRDGCNKVSLGCRLVRRGIYAAVRLFMLDLCCLVRRLWCLQCGRQACTHRWCLVPQPTGYSLVPGLVEVPWLMAWHFLTVLAVTRQRQRGPTPS